jgi:hypothetical protein
MPSVEWYRPSKHGLEEKIRAKLAHLRGLDAGAKKSE